MSELTDRICASACQPVTKMLRDRKLGVVFSKIHGCGCLHRLGGLDPQLLRGGGHDPDRVLRVHAMRIFSSCQSLTAEQHASCWRLRDPDAFG